MAASVLVMLAAMDRNPAFARVRRLIRGDARALVAFASELIRIPTENPPGRDYPRAAAVIAARWRSLGFATRTVNPSGSGPCVLGTHGSGATPLYLSGHYDVVPAQSRTLFVPVVRRGQLHGRGSADMKGGLAAMTCAARAIARSGIALDGRLVLVAVPDEETSGPRGTVALASAGLIDPEAAGMLTMEPTGGVVWNASRGVITLRITVRGKPAHVGLHFHGVNAFRGLLEVAGRLMVLERRVARRRTRHAIEPAAAKASILLLGGELAGGHHFNVVPDRASLTVDRRLNPEEDLGVERARLLAAVDAARARGFTIDVETLQEGLPSSTPARGPLVRALAKSIAEVTGHSASFELCPGVLETRHYAALGIPALAYGPGSLAVSHGPDERVAVKNLVEAAEVYALTALRLLAPGAAAGARGTVRRPRTARGRR